MVQIETTSASQKAIFVPYKQKIYYMVQIKEYLFVTSLISVPYAQKCSCMVQIQYSGSFLSKKQYISLPLNLYFFPFMPEYKQCSTTQPLVSCLTAKRKRTPIILLNNQGSNSLNLYFSLYTLFFYTLFSFLSLFF